MGEYRMADRMQDNNDASDIITNVCISIYTNLDLFREAGNQGVGRIGVLSCTSECHGLKGNVLI